MTRFYISRDAYNPAMPTATGKFEVQLTPLGPDRATEDTWIGRMGLEKTFHGDMQGSSKGEMLAFGTKSAGYVAMEQVSCNLAGRTGTFVLQHSGTIVNGDANLSIIVTPDSGRDGLEGITGHLQIDNAGGVHSYTFEYTLP